MTQPRWGRPDELVAWVEELLSGGDALEAQLQQIRTRGVRLLASTFHHLLA